MSSLSHTFWAGRRVLVSGHSGFKGHWLSLWLRSLGAEVTGFSRRRSADPEVESIQGDVTDLAAVRAAVDRARPEIVFHMAGPPAGQNGPQDPGRPPTPHRGGPPHRRPAPPQSAPPPPGG